MVKYSWLYYSQYSEGVFCRACAFFALEKVGQQQLGQFVTKPFNTWGKMSYKGKAHSSLEYHQTSAAKMDEFITRFKNPSTAIDAIMDSNIQKTIDTNEKVIMSLLKVVILCGKQGLALRAWSPR